MLCLGFMAFLAARSIFWAAVAVIIQLLLSVIALRPKGLIFIRMSLVL